MIADDDLTLSEVIESRLVAAARMAGAEQLHDPVEALQAIGLSWTQADALMNDCRVTIKAGDLNRVADTLGLKRDLLSCVVCPTPEETARWHLEQIRDELECEADQGDDLAIAHLEMLHSYLDYGGDWETLCLSLLEHFWPQAMRDYWADRDED